MKLLKTTLILGAFALSASTASAQTRNTARFLVAEGSELHLPAMREEARAVVKGPAFLLVKKQQQPIRPLMYKEKEKTKENLFEKVIHWDFKLTLRVNSNLNIIFTYS